MWVKSKRPQEYSDTIRTIPVWSIQDFPGEPVTFDIYKLYINEKYYGMYGRNVRRSNELTLATDEDDSSEEDKSNEEDSEEDSEEYIESNNDDDSDEEDSEEESEEDEIDDDGNNRTTGRFIGCFYCGDKNHNKRNCKKWIKERDQLYCTYCDVKGHDNTTCFLLHPKMKNRIGGVRRFNKFGTQWNNSSDSE